MALFFPSLVPCGTLILSARAACVESGSRFFDCAMLQSSALLMSFTDYVIRTRQLLGSRGEKKANCGPDSSVAHGAAASSSRISIAPASGSGSISRTIRAVALVPAAKMAI